jgi:hypothetical protein
MSAPDTDRLAGICHAVFCFDVGFQIDLDALERRLDAAARVRAVRARRPAPAWFEYEPAPVGLTLAGDPVQVGVWTSEPAAECQVYDFGAVAVRYRIPFDGPPETLVALGAALYDHDALLDDARERVERLRRDAGDAIERSCLSALTEDFVAYAVQGWGGGPPAAVVDRNAPALARLLQAERGELSAERVTQTLATRIGYSPGDLSIVDWNAALLFDPEPDDILAVLTHANIELLEMRLLDGRLDDLLTQAHEVMARVSRRSTLWPGGVTGRAVRRFAELQMDSALLFEGVNNAIKLIGDQHLARVYVIASDRLNLPTWDASVLRKLGVAESVYQKLSDAAGAKRMEILEWIIIVLILVSIVMPFLGIKY